MSTRSIIETLLTSFREKLDEVLALVGKPAEFSRNMELIEAFLAENMDVLRSASPEELRAHSELIADIMGDVARLQKETDARLDWFAAMNVSIAEKVSDKSR